MCDANAFSQHQKHWFSHWTFTKHLFQFGWPFRMLLCFHLHNGHRRWFDLVCIFSVEDFHTKNQSDIFLWSACDKTTMYTYTKRLFPSALRLWLIHTFRFCCGVVTVCTYAVCCALRLLAWFFCIYTHTHSTRYVFYSIAGCCLCVWMCLWCASASDTANYNHIRSNNSYAIMLHRQLLCVCVCVSIVGWQCFSTFVLQVTFGLCFDFAFALTAFGWLLAIKIERQNHLGIRELGY